MFHIFCKLNSITLFIDHQKSPCHQIIFHGTWQLSHLLLDVLHEVLDNYSVYGFAYVDPIFLESDDVICSSILFLRSSFHKTPIFLNEPYLRAIWRIYCFFSRIGHCYDHTSLRCPARSGRLPNLAKIM